jgi:uncharacterized protein (DUF924 family)
MTVSMDRRDKPGDDELDGSRQFRVDMTPDTIIAFWKEVGETRWFAVDPALDADIRRRFESVWQDARAGNLADWENSAEGALALVILLDQFPRNMFRGTAEAFSTDAQARGVAERAVVRGYDLETPPPLRPFFYLPFMHSENDADQDRCVSLIAERVGENSVNYPFALGHRAVIRQFGRFPGRNAALGRATTPEEHQFLSSPHPHTP